MFLVRGSRLLFYDRISMYVILIAYELQALQYTHYQDVFGVLYIDKWTFAVDPECQSAKTLSA